MPNDAKLGLVLGIGLVIAIGVVFYRKDPSVALVPSAPAAVTPAGPPGTSPRGQYRPVRAKAAGESFESPAAAAGRDDTTADVANNEAKQ